MKSKQSGATLFQAVLRADHDRIKELADRGQHPLTILERCIEVRGDAVVILMRHVQRNCPDSRAVVKRVARHLWMIDRYPRALSELESWLSKD